MEKNGAQLVDVRGKLWGRGCLIRMLGLGAEVLWVSSHGAVSEAALSDTSRMEVADPPSLRLSAWGQTA